MAEDNYLQQHGKTKCVVYLITHLASGKLYVGQTTGTLINRWQQHAETARGPTSRYSKQTAIARALRNYGLETFSIRILEKCESLEQLNQREAFWIHYYGSMTPFGYNLTAGGNSAPRAPEVGRKISLANKGRVKGPEWRANLSKSRTGFKMSDEQRQKISEVQRGRKQSPEHIEARAASRRGKKQSAEWIEKRSIALRGRKLSPEHCQKISELRLGKKRGPHSEETKAKMREAAMRRYHG